MTSTATATSLSDQKGRRNADPAASPTKRGFSLDALGVAILENLKLLLLGPVIVGLAAFGIASVLPKWYTSVAYLRLDEAGARSVDASMLSSPVLDKVLAEFNAPRDTPDARRRYLRENRRIVVAPGEIQKTSNLFRLEYSDKDPRTAQKVNSLFIDAWLDSTKPPPEKRARIEAEIERREILVKSISQLIDRLQKDAPSLVTQSLQGELATPIVNLEKERDANLAAITELRNSLNGMSRDVIFGPPNLPVEPSWPKKGVIAVLAGASAGLLLLMLVTLRRFWWISI